ncbi:MAG TPA: hypothetical protein VLZ84_10545 [Asticcacaulis sp.]|nr:hypothetical protein [Asticcacaulis sp.]
MESAEKSIFIIPDKKRGALLKKTFSSIKELNRIRVIFAHSHFDISNNNSSLVFKRVTAKEQLKVEDVEYSLTKMNAIYAEIELIKSEIHQIIENMIPYKPSLDFKDPRNSMYIPLLSGF